MADEKFVDQSSQLRKRREVKIALLGAGTVGTQVARLLVQQHDVLCARAGVDLKLIGIAVRNVNAPRDPAIDRELLTDRPDELIAQADLVIELIGGVDLTLKLVRQALESGASVVTGNKALLATHGPELYELAAAHDADLYYEAAVAGAVPVVYGLRESLAGDQVNAIFGILNGTTNFILDEMTRNGMDFDEALSVAQELGYAEADPSADIDGLDVAAKIAILASLAFHTRVALDDVHVEGIRSITDEDIASARRAGYIVKLIATARRKAEGIELCVAPTLLPEDHPLANIHGSFNAILIEAESAGRVMFYGRGAGGAPTASAVLSDVVAAANKKVVGGRAPAELVYGNLPILDSQEVSACYYLKTMVNDEAGALARITRVFAQHNVSISSLRQRPLYVSEGRKLDEKMSKNLVYVTVVTHEARNKDIAAVVDDLSDVEGVQKVVRVMRVEDE